MADNKVRFGARNVHYALVTDEGFGEWKPLAGAVQIQFEPQGSQNIFYADDIAYFVSNPAAQDQITLELADFTEVAKVDLLGYVRDETSGLLYEPANTVRKPFVLGYEVQGDGTILRGVRYGGTLSRPSEAHNTQNDSVTPDTQSIVGTFTGHTFRLNNEDVHIIGASTTNEGEEHTAYDAFWSAVPEPGKAPQAI